LAALVGVVDDAGRPSAGERHVEGIEHKARP
jgi:hypothetical protein